ncbi:hypothetical protein HDR61_05350 [bacterium]|nr:hypothetical protein [Bacteroidales bacterium]MBD5401134.1 hypothetical protein [bacterium]
MKKPLSETVPMTLRFVNEAHERRANDLAALARMKEIEKQKASQLRSCRIDPRTVISATPDRLRELRHKHGLD